MDTRTEPTLLDGKALSKKVRAELASRIDALRARGVFPRLDVLVAADDPASITYVRMKRKWAAEIGIESFAFDITSETTQNELIDKIHELNENPDVHGVLIQHPLPKHLDEGLALEALGAEKDVDGITPHSLGLLTAGRPGFRCATPLGMMKFLDEYQIDVTGKNALVIGRSVILGKPAALMLLERNATVTIAHSRTKNLERLCADAELLVAAVGRPEMIRGEWLKPGVVVLDAGYNRVEGRTHDVGDVHFESVSQKASHITPVPGGVGPMTVAMLLSNTVDAAEKASAP